MTDPRRNVPDGYVLLRARSHRARERLYRKVGREQVVPLCSVYHGHVYAVPPETVDGALSIPSVGRARVPADAYLGRPWT